MLQEAQKVIAGALNRSFTKKLAQYLHDCVREEVKSSTFRNLKEDKENKWVFLDDEEKLFTNFDQELLLDGSDSYLTELMIQSEMNSKEKYLIYGYLFLVGKNSKVKKNNKFLTPLLYVPCKLERRGVNIVLSAQEDILSLNTGALAQLMKRDDEQEADAMLSGLLDVVPELPLNAESLEIFLTTLKSLVPEIEIETTSLDDIKQDFEDFYSRENIEKTLEEGDFDFDAIDEIAKRPRIKVEKLTLQRKCAVILTKRPSITAGVLHELTQIAEKPQGIYRETVLDVIEHEYLLQKGKIPNEKIEEKEVKDFFPITPLALSDSQEDVIKKIEENDFLAVYGPPGTGKSQTIVNLVSHLIANGKSVLVASRMDKAVDVVAQRLNTLNAPYLALRAGRANYQTLLNFKLEDLLSNKVDLDSGYSDAVMAEPEDMKNLCDEIGRLEEGAQKIFGLEKNYTAVNEEKNETKEAIGDFVIIKNPLGIDEISQVKKLLGELKKYENKRNKNILDKIFEGIKLNKIKKILNLKEKINTSEISQRLPVELDLEYLEAKLRKIENQIYKIGNLHQILKKIKSLRKKQRKLAVDILRNKRRTALKNILCDRQKRQRLMIHSKSLVSRKLSQQNRLLEKEDFKPLLSAFPCWCVTTYAISNSLPLKPGLFDVVIIDEASQCDIASCLPILFRAKKAVIVGDDKQLPHLSFLEKAKEQSFLNQYGIEDRYQLLWRFRTNSMFDVANYYSTTPTLLDEHFRSPKPIIEFSNREFYGGRIKVMRPYFETVSPVELVEVKEAKVDIDVTRNQAECEAVIKKVQDIIYENEKNKDEKPVSIGIISPFRGQVELIKKAVLRVFSQETIAAHEIEVGTAHTFQGDERDVMLMSWAIATNSHSQSLMFLQKPNLFNVAITRARKRLINFISKPVNELPEGLLRDYLEFVLSQDKIIASRKNIFKNLFEKEVFEHLQNEFTTHELCAGVEFAGICADIMIDGKLIVEIDGVEDEFLANVNETKKQALMERLGYEVVRVTKREWDLSKDAALDRIRSSLVQN